MKSVAVICTDPQVNAVIREACAAFSDEFESVELGRVPEAIEYLNYELPELTVIHVTDQAVDLAAVIPELRNDPWLHSSGLIIVFDPDVACVRTSALRDFNLISVIETNQLSQHFPRLLRIVSMNQNIVHQRDIHELLSSTLSGSFVLGNDPFDLATYTNLLANFLYNANLIDHEHKERFYVAVMELLMNAIEHGNCEIDYQEKSRYLASGGNPIELIRERNSDPEIGARKVYLSYRIRPERSSFTIRDQGKGFDWKSYATPTGEGGLEEAHGRGIFMASHYLSELRFNECGNEVSFALDHAQRDGIRVPEAFASNAEIYFRDGDVVFEEGEKSSHLYYIVSGTFEVIAGGRKVSELTAADVFLGEMSFLLGNRRSATVRTCGEGTLIQISKREFITAIKQRPHYGLMLARLISQRLARHHTGS